MRTVAIVTLVVALIFASIALVSVALRTSPQTRPEQPSLSAGEGEMAPMGSPVPMAAMGGGSVVPPVTGFYQGQEISFIHTEASDQKVADILTAMMGSPVLVVPSLAHVPQSALADVFVFTNGIPGGGPMGFQPDVFDSAPGDPGYSPLRALNLVTWKERVAVRELRSAEEVKAAERNGEVTIEHLGVVINIPFLTWPGGHR